VVAFLLCVRLGMAIATPIGAADETAGVAEHSLDEGKRLYKEAQFELAVAELQQAIGALENEPDLTRRRGRLADAFFHLGLAFLGLNEREAARDAFKNVLRLDPEFRPDAHIYAPKVIELFEQARIGLPVTSSRRIERESAQSTRVPERRQSSGRLRLGFELLHLRSRYADTDDYGAIPGTLSMLGSGWMAGPLGAAWGLRLGVRLPNGVDRLEIGAQINGEADRSMSQEVVADDMDAGRLVVGRRNVSHRVKEIAFLDIKWSRAVLRNPLWTLDAELGYHTYLGDFDTWLSVDENGARGSYATMARSSSVRVHGFRLGLNAQRVLAGPLSIEIAPGYAVHFTSDDRHLVTSRFNSQGASESVSDSLGELAETQGGMKLALNARVAVRDGLALRLGYRWRTLGSFYAGDLRESGVVASVMVGAIR
jgi:hypothetical protein